jgi:glycosyltransferase involved in cell wall biosynthesis
MINLFPPAPAISIVMVVKNGGQIIIKSIDSILCQTFSNFEFIIINGCSTDETLEVIRQHQNLHIQVYS